MKRINIILILLLVVHYSFAQIINITSPNGDIHMAVNYLDNLSYSINFRGKTLVNPSSLGFELKGEETMHKDFALLNKPEIQKSEEIWSPIIRNKHAHINLKWNEVILQLKEKSGEMRCMDLTIRLFDNGVAFRYTLFGSQTIGNRQITRELTEFSVADSSKAWIVEYGPNRYSSGQEGEFILKPINEVTTATVAGLPFLIEVDKQNYLAITEAHIDDYPGFYIGASTNEKNGNINLTTKLAPLPGEDENGVKCYFSESHHSPWRVILIGENPGKFIESEIIQGLNPPCAIEDTSWIKPGIAAWDHWWSGEVKMEMEVIKEYIDLAATEGWPYMLIDWQWYGKFNCPEADITKPAPQLDMPSILEYAKSKNVRCWLWLYSSDVNRNDNYKKAFAIYEKWGIAGVKIDFMDRDDQEMVNWYKRIIQEAAKHKLLVNFHGAYKPDGIERTWPNLLTREGVLGAEYSKFGYRLPPHHNVTLSFTRMLAGPMDYTPGGFLNVSREQFKAQSPTMMANTRVAELSKFVIYESPFSVFCDHPKHIYGQIGEDFMRLVPTTWDDIRFLQGYPDKYIAMAKRSGNKWFIGVMNGDDRRSITLDLNFLSPGYYELTCWEDGKHADKNATNVKKRTLRINTNKPFTIKMANGGGFVGILSPIN